MKRRVKERNTKVKSEGFINHLFMWVYVFFKSWKMKKDTENKFTVIQTCLYHVDFYISPFLIPCFKVSLAIMQLELCLAFQSVSSLSGEGALKCCKRILGSMLRVYFSPSYGLIPLNWSCPSLSMMMPKQVAARSSRHSLLSPCWSSPDLCQLPSA